MTDQLPDKVIAFGVKCLRGVDHHGDTRYYGGDEHVSVSIYQCRHMQKSSPYWVAKGSLEEFGGESMFSGGGPPSRGDAGASPQAAAADLDADLRRWGDGIAKVIARTKREDA